MKSKTLMEINAKSLMSDIELKKKGFAGSGSLVDARTFEPSDEYPWPWRVSCSKEGICSIYASNNEKVCDWITMRQARQIMVEVNPDKEVKKR